MTLQQDEVATNKETSVAERSREWRARQNVAGWRCKLCMPEGVRFKTEAALRKHKSERHGVAMKVYVCDDCKWTGATVARLRKHKEQKRCGQLTRQERLEARTCKKCGFVADRLSRVELHTKCDRVKRISKRSQEN